MQWAAEPHGRAGGCGGGQRRRPPSSPSPRPRQPHQPRSPAAQAAAPLRRSRAARGPPGGAPGLFHPVQPLPPQGGPAARPRRPRRLGPRGRLAFPLGASPAAWRPATAGMPGTRAPLAALAWAPLPRHQLHRRAVLPGEPNLRLQRQLHSARPRVRAVAPGRPRGRRGRPGRTFAGGRCGGLGRGCRRRGRCGCGPRGARLARRRRRPGPAAAALQREEVPPAPSAAPATSTGGAAPRLLGARGALLLGSARAGCPRPRAHLVETPPEESCAPRCLLLVPRGQRRPDGRDNLQLVG